MKSKLLIASVVVALAAALILGPANFSFDASAKNQVNGSPSELTGNPALLSLSPATLAGIKNNDRSQHCGTKDIDETVAAELQSSLDRFNSGRSKGQIRKSGAVTIPVYFHVVNKGTWR